MLENFRSYSLKQLGNIWNGVLSLIGHYSHKRLEGETSAFLSAGAHTSVSKDTRIAEIYHVSLGAKNGT